MTEPVTTRPLISVVLPVHGVEQYLRACLDSILGGRGLEEQAPTVEVVAVEDASPDRCAQILDERAASDPRLRVLHRAESGGPGQARNTGLAQARGDYIWFVDPDDLLAPGALAAVAAAIATDRPDVVLVDYLILHRSGRTEQSPGSGLLRPAAVPGPGTGQSHGPARGPGTALARTLTLSDRPQLINRTMTVWSKVFRRAFLTGLSVPFPPGIHEDVPVSCAALLEAERICLVDRVCYLYRQRRRSFLAVASMAHFSIFDSYAEVFARMAGGDCDLVHPGAPQVSDGVRAAVFGRAMEHYSTILASGLVPVRARRRFFRRMAHDYRRYHPAGFARPPGPRGLKLALISRNAYWAYEVLAPLNEARVRVRHLARGRADGADVAVRAADHGQIT